MRPFLILKVLLVWVACVAISLVVAELVSDSVDCVAVARSTILVKLPDRVLLAGKVLRPGIRAAAAALKQVFHAMCSHPLLLLGLLIHVVLWLVFLGVRSLVSKLRYFGIPVGPFFCSFEAALAVPGLVLFYTSGKDDGHRYIIPFLLIQMTTTQLWAFAVSIHLLIPYFTIFVNRGLLRRIRRAIVPNVVVTLCKSVSRLSAVSVVTTAVLSCLFLGIPALRISCVKAPLTATGCPAGGAAAEPSTLCMAVLGIDNIHPMETQKGVTCTTSSCRLDAFDYLDRDIIGSDDTAGP